METKDKNSGDKLPSGLAEGSTLRKRRGQTREAGEEGRRGVVEESVGILIKI